MSDAIRDVTERATAPLSALESRTSRTSQRASGVFVCLPVVSSEGGVDVRGVGLMHVWYNMGC